MPYKNVTQVTQYKYTLCNKNIHYRELRPNIHIRKISNGLAKFCFLKRYEFSKTSHVILKKRNRTHGDTKNEQNDIQWPCEYKFSYSFPSKCLKTWYSKNRITQNWQTIKFTTVKLILTLSWESIVSYPHSKHTID